MFTVNDLERFPALAIARSAGQAGGTAPAVFNAVNEVAVALFLDGRIGFLDIPALCARVLDAHEPRAVDSLATLMEVDRWARAEARAAQSITSRG